jgi:4-amino-4-deoxy-L-arabinose transferase-like glycosyltransferase
MKSLALVVACVVVALGVAGFLIPDAMVTIGQYAASPAGLYAAAALRVGIGLVLILAARESRSPWTLRIIGAAVLIVGLATPLFGVEGMRARLDWEAQHISFLRFEAVLFVCLGGFIVSAILPVRPINNHRVDRL